MKWDVVQDQVARHHAFETVHAEWIGRDLDPTVVKEAGIAAEVWEEYQACRAWESMGWPNAYAQKSLRRCLAALEQYADQGAVLREYRGVTEHGTIHLWRGVEWDSMTERQRLLLDWDNCSSPCPPHCLCPTAPCTNCPGQCPPGYPCGECNC